MAHLLPKLPDGHHAPIGGSTNAIELIEFDAYSRMQKTKLRNNLLARFRRVRDIEQRRKQVGQIEVQIPQTGNQSLQIQRFGIKKLHAVIHLFPELVPIHVNEGKSAGNLSNNGVSNSGPFAEPGQVQLFHPAALADVVDQIEGIPFSS
jgi:hypothetical protein